MSKFRQHLTSSAAPAPACGAELENKMYLTGDVDKVDCVNCQRTFDFLEQKKLGVKPGAAPAAGLLGDKTPPSQSIPGT